MSGSPSPSDPIARSVRSSSVLGADASGCGRPARRGSGARVLPLFLVLALMVGCHTYQPLLGDPPAPGDEVRVRLSAVAADELSQRKGWTVRSVEGRVLHAVPDSMELDVGWGAVYAGTVFEGRRDTLSIRQNEFVELDRKEFSRGRTVLVAAGVVAVAAALFGAVSGGGGGERGGGNGNGLF